jgi:2-amino-4-hydroxy-6-hydroxymethyldihydropteridine diphosphokinase
MPFYFLGLGSNVNPYANVPRMLAALLELAPTLQMSRIMATEPVGLRSAENSFLNLAVAFHYPGDAATLKTRLNAIEVALGRDRARPDKKVRDRTADLDILFVLTDRVTPPRGADLPTEPYMRPLVLDLLASLDLCTATTCGDALPPGASVIFNGAPIGRHPATLDRQPQLQKQRQFEYV